ncbi:MAG: hypothetical protein LCH84_03450 [Gemmatimonadetes bacterium]|nr:hypothetical protein [Gemmatimonadota bacterium]
MSTTSNGGSGASGARPPVAALLTVAGAVTIAVASWWWFSRAADAGVARLDRIAKLRTLCTAAYAEARSATDTMRVDRLALPDTVDPESRDRIDRCGVFRSTGG